ncbi:polysaccharide deacetylase family protein [Microbacteriaceae bacterium 4G12]
MKKYFMIFICLILIGSLVGCSNEKGDPQANINSLSGDGCLVLNYHRIRTPNLVSKTIGKLSNNAELNIYSVYTDQFKAQIQYLKQKGVQFITPEDLKAYITKQKQLPKKCALITFDDIDVSVYENAYPILKKEQVPFTMFIITGEVGNKDFDHLQLASWDQLKEMQQSGLATIGTHTNKLHYLEKDEKPPFVKETNLEAFKKDTKQAKETFKEHFGVYPRYFAYPYGFGIPQTDEFLLQEGYELIFSLNAGIVKPDDPSFFINRVLIDDHSWKAVEKWANT